MGIFKRTALFSALLIVAFSHAALAAEDVLKFYVSNKKVAQFSARQLEQKISPQIEKFFDPDYGKIKSFRCLPIRKVMRLAFGPQWKKLPYAEAMLTARDGYASFSKAAKLGQEGGCLAISDADVPSWEPVGMRQVNPGPFYLAWTRHGQKAENGYPWPYQLASIRLVKFADRYPEVVPKGASRHSAAYHGYILFREQCLRCHSMNQEGGKIGPDLNAPQSITAYRSKKMIEEFIRHPSKFRYSEMPDHPLLTQKDLDDLYAYFLFKSKQPEKSGKK